MNPCLAAGRTSGRSLKSCSSNGIPDTSARKLQFCDGGMLQLCSIAKRPTRPGHICHTRITKALRRRVSQDVLRRYDVSKGAEGLAWQEARTVFL